MNDELLRKKTDYSRGKKEAAHRVLIELANLFEQYKGDMCVIGGWVPSLMLPNKDHIGSIDVDILINHLSLQDEGYQNISRILTNNGYQKHDKQFFTFVKVITIDEIDYSVDVDILAGKYGGTDSKFSQHVQGIKALRATGGNFAFEVPLQEINLESQRPDGSIDYAKVSVVAVVPYFIMKVAALGRGKAKDAYDLYYLLKNYVGGIDALILEFQPYKKEIIVQNMKSKLREKFKTENHSGVQDIINFMELYNDEEIEIMRREIYERFAIFLKSIE